MTDLFLAMSKKENHPVNAIASVAFRSRFMTVVPVSRSRFRSVVAINHEPKTARRTRFPIRFTHLTSRARRCRDTVASSDHVPNTPATRRLQIRCIHFTIEALLALHDATLAAHMAYAAHRLPRVILATLRCSRSLTRRVSDCQLLQDSKAADN